MSLVTKLALCAAVTAAAVLPAPIGAQENSEANISQLAATAPCTDPDATLSKILSAGMHQGMAMKMSGDTDADFKHTMQMMTSMAMAMTKLFEAIRDHVR